MPVPNPKWTGVVSEKTCVLKFDHPAEFERFKRTLAGKRFVLSLEPRKLKRTLDQNAGWWGVIIPAIAEHCGYEDYEHDNLHYSLLHKCFGETTKGGVTSPNKVSSSNLSVEEFTHLIDWAYRVFAVEFGCDIPPLDGAL